jgi:hypothetical protein
MNKDLLTINHEHEPTETLAELDERVRSKEKAEEAPEEIIEPAVETSEEEPQSDELAPVEEPAEKPVEEPQADEPALQPEQPVQPDVPSIVEPKSEAVSSAYSLDDDEIEPSLGGTLNATSEQAAEDARRAAMNGQNKTILSHAYLGGQAEQVSNPLSSTPAGFPGTPPAAPGSVGINEVEEDVRAAYASADQRETSAANSGPTYGIGGDRVIEPLTQPEPAAPAAPAVPSFGLPLPPPLPDFSQSFTAAPAVQPLTGQQFSPVLPPIDALPITPEPTTQSEILGDILAPEPTAAYSMEPIETPIVPSDPGQFKIPS